MTISGTLSARALPRYRSTLTSLENEELSRLSQELADLGFAMDFKDPYYSKFIESMSRYTKFQKSQLSAEEQKEQDAVADEIIAEILREIGQ